MKKEFWDERYSEKAYVYGEAPNEFLKEFLAQKKPGRILLPGDGEGRNSTFAAQLGWEVEAFDYSLAGQKKALALGEKHRVTFSFEVDDYENFNPKNAPFDVIGLIYTHCDPQLRRTFFRRLSNWLKPGGAIVLEGFRKEQLGKPSGGPKSLDMLWSKEELETDFREHEIVYLKEISVVLHEGLYHEGEASVVRMIVKKKGI